MKITIVVNINEGDELSNASCVVPGTTTTINQPFAGGIGRAGEAVQRLLTLAIGAAARGEAVQRLAPVVGAAAKGKEGGGIGEN